MFGFKRTQQVESTIAQVQDAEVQLKNELAPECELLSDCDFAEVSGGTFTTVRPIAL